MSYADLIEIPERRQSIMREVKCLKRGKPTFPELMNKTIFHTGEAPVREGKIRIRPPQPHSGKTAEEQRPRTLKPTKEKRRTC